MSIRRVFLQDVAVITRDIVEADRIKTGTLYVGLENIESGGQLANVRAVEPGELASSKFAFTARHILYGKLRPYLAKIARPTFEGICSTDILPVLPGPELDAGYLSWFLRSPEMVARAASLAVGANLPRLSPSALAEMQLPLPPLAEQRSIAEILDKANTLRAKRRAVIAQLEDLVQSVFLEMFGDPVVNPKRWPELPLCDLIERIDGGWSPICLDRPAEADEWGVLKLSAITSCEYDDAENKALPPDLTPKRGLEVCVGDLLLSRKNTYELVAACALVQRTRPKLLLPDLIFRLRLRENAPVTATFLHHLLTFPSKRKMVQKLAGGSAGSMPNISKGRLERLSIELPPLRDQAHFAQRVAAVARWKEVQRCSRDRLDVLFASLQHRAFRGEL